jgi:hypothetical protein
VNARNVSARATASTLTLTRSADGGRLTLAGAAELRGDALRLAQGTLDDARMTLRTEGAVAALSDGSARLSGPVAAQLKAARFVQPALTTSGITAEAQTDLRLLGGGSPLRLTGRAERLAAVIDGRPAALRDVEARFAGPARGEAGGFAWNADGSASARGGFDAAGAAALAQRVPVLSGETRTRTIWSARWPRSSSPRRRCASRSRPVRMVLSTAQPIRMDSRSGAKLTLAGGPLLTLAGAGAGGEATLTAEGGGLPAMTLALEAGAPARGRFDSRCG